MQIVFSKLNSLPEQAKQILYQGSGFFFQAAWFELLISHVYTSHAKHTTGYLYASDEDGLPVAICPARYAVTAWRLRSFYSLTCFYSPIFKFLPVGQSDHDRRIEGFFRALKPSQLKWHRFIIYALAKEDADCIIQQLSRSGINSVGFYCFANWFLPVSFSDFQAYLASRISRVQNTVRRKSLAFNKLANTHIKLYFEEKQLIEAANDYAEVYNDSWKLSEAYPEFMVALLRLAAQQGGLRLCIAYLGSEPIAAQFWIVADQTAYIYKLAYKEAYKSLGIGTVLTATLMQHVMEIDRVSTVDYLSGDDAYKQDWMTHRRERWGVVVFNTSTIYGCVLYWIEIFKRCLKNFIKID